MLGTGATSGKEPVNVLRSLTGIAGATQSQPHNRSHTIAGKAGATHVGRVRRVFNRLPDSKTVMYQLTGRPDECISVTVPAFRPLPSRRRARHTSLVRDCRVSL